MCFVSVLPKEIIQYILNKVIISHCQYYYSHDRDDTKIIVYLTTNRSMGNAYYNTFDWSMVHLIKNLSMVHPVFRNIFKKHFTSYDGSLICKRSFFY